MGHLNRQIIKTEKDLVNARKKEHNNLYQQVRGAISIPHTFGGGAPIQITITPNADASTAVHEMGHYFLWEMENLARLLPYDTELQTDLATAS